MNENNNKEKVTLKERWNNFNEKHPKFKGVLVKVGLGIIAAAGGGAIGYTIGHRDGTALATLAETATENAGDIVESVSETLQDVAENVVDF